MRNRRLAVFLRKSKILSKNGKNNGFLLSPPSAPIKEHSEARRLVSSDYHKDTADLGLISDYRHENCGVRDCQFQAAGIKHIG
jgi:hypothetical protein